MIANSQIPFNWFHIRSFSNTTFGSRRPFWIYRNFFKSQNNCKIPMNPLTWFVIHFSLTVVYINFFGEHSLVFCQRASVLRILKKILPSMICEQYGPELENKCGLKMHKHLALFRLWEPEDRQFCWDESKKMPNPFAM